MKDKQREKGKSKNKLSKPRNGPRFIDHHERPADTKTQKLLLRRISWSLQPSPLVDSNMEELQDAIEDAQYMNAMHDGVPRPTKEWVKPSPEKVQAYIEKLQTNHPKELEIESICRGCLGLYLFIKYVKEEGSTVHGEFILDVASFRVSTILTLFVYYRISCAINIS